MTVQRFTHTVDHPATGQPVVIPATNGKPLITLDELYEGSIVHGRTEGETVNPLLNAAISLIPHDMGIVKSIMGKLTADQRRGKLEYALRDHLKTGREFDSFIKSCPLPADEKPASIFVPLSFEDVLNMPPKEWLIDGLFGAGDLGMIFGPPGSGKTFIVIDLILAACLGEPFAMRFNVARPLSVAYCAGEGLAGLPDRFKAAAAHHGVSALPGLTIFRQVPQLYTESQTAANIDQFVLAWKATGKPLDLLMIDTLHSATGGADENSAQHMGVVLESCKLAIKELGCAVLLVHHSNKAGTGERGSSAMRGAMDYMIEVSPTGEQLSGKGKLTCSKLKDGEAWEGQRFSLVAVDGCDSVRVWWDELATSGQGGKKDEVESGVLKFLKQYRGKRFTANDIAEQVAGKDKSDRHLQKVLNSLNESGKIRKDLRNPDKDSSSHNPFVYWYDQQAAAAAEVLSSL
jgi:hypothetical protein